VSVRAFSIANISGYRGDDKQVADLRGLAALLQDGWQTQQAKEDRQLLESRSGGGVCRQLKWWRAASATA
jgi:hypothetical protein